MRLPINLSTLQGTDFEYDMYLVDSNSDIWDLTDTSFTGTIKKNYTSANSYSFTFESNTESGEVSALLDADTTLSMDSGKYVFNINMTQNSVTIGLLGGYFVVKPTTIMDIELANTFTNNNYTISVDNGYE